MLIPVVCGFVGYKISSKSFMIAIFLSLLVTAGTGYMVGEFDIKSMVLGISANAVSLLITHLYFNFKKAPAHIAIPRIKTNVRLYVYGVMRGFLPSNIVKSINWRVRNHGAHYYTFCIFGILYYTVPLFSTALSGNLSVDLVMYFRIVAAFMCLGVCFYEYLPINLSEKYLPTFWYICLMFGLPMISTYSVLVTNTALFWIVNAIFSTFVLAMLVDLKSFVILQSFGAFIGYFIFKAVGISSPVVIPVDSNFSMAAYLYCFASLILAAVMKKVQDDKINTLEMIGGAVAHEVKTPLAASHMAAEAIDTLVKDARYENENSVSFGKEDFDMLKSFSEKIKKSTTSGIAAVDMILNALKNPNLKSIDSGDSSNVIVLLTEAIRDADLEDKDLKRIMIEPNSDFKASCSDTYLKHLFMNLINNFITHAGEDAHLNITVSDHKIFFKDNGNGIASENVNRIFKKFASFGDNKGTGIGLALCSMIMESMGGSIECRSMIGEGTVFTVSFRKLTD
jgi:signal transduction histidine kinase